MSSEEKAIVKGTNELDAIKADPELSRMYRESAELGAENLANSLPLLKVHQVGKSTKNELSTGGQPDDGYFFYGPTGQQFESIETHILTISKGFKALDNNGEEKFNQIMGGVIISDGDYKPFVMFMTGKKLANMWEFGKEARQFTKKGIPLFALTVNLTTASVPNKYGKSWLINFEIVKAEDGTPTLIHDLQEFNYLKDKVEVLKDTIASVIDAKAESNDSEPVMTAKPLPEDPDDVNF